MDINRRLRDLKGILLDMDSVLVAFSGGVDSTFLLKVASTVLGENVAALTATSPTYLTVELEDAKKRASKIGAHHIIIESNELKIPRFSKNDYRRCYYCKKELFSLAWKEADALGFKHVADGSNLDDLKDYRPGMEAAKELRVRSPLVEARLSKDDIRKLSKRLGLVTWNKPPLACLSSRFPYGTRITSQRLKMVEESEAFLRKKGFTHCRVRYHGDTARIEVGSRDIQELSATNIRRAVIKKFKEIGFTYVTLDLEGYRSGSLNEALDFRPLIDTALSPERDSLEQKVRS